MSTEIGFGLLGRTSCIPDGIADVHDLLRQGIVGDERSLPDLIEEFLLFYNKIPVFDQVDQKIIFWSA